jgi:hypothetical protein
MRAHVPQVATDGKRRPFICGGIAETVVAVTVRNSGKCDMEATGNPTDRVYGVLFSIAMNEEKPSMTRKALIRAIEKIAKSRWSGQSHPCQRWSLSATAVCVEWP